MISNESSTWRTHSIVFVVISVYHRSLSLSVVRFEHFVRHIIFFYFRSLCDSSVCVCFFCSFFILQFFLFILFAIVLTPFLRLLITIYHNCFSVSFICCSVLGCIVFFRRSLTVCVCLFHSLVRLLRDMLCGICRALGIWCAHLVRKCLSKHQTLYWVICISRRDLRTTLSMAANLPWNAWEDRHLFLHCTSVESGCQRSMSPNQLLVAWCGYL